MNISTMFLLLRNSSDCCLFAFASLPHMSIAAGVILSIALQQVDAAPDTQGHRPRPTTIVCKVSTALLKNSIRSSLSAACSAALKIKIIRLHFHPIGQFRTGQNFRPVRPPAAAFGAGWIRPVHIKGVFLSASARYL